METDNIKFDTSTTNYISFSAKLGNYYMYANNICVITTGGESVINIELKNFDLNKNYNDISDFMLVSNSTNKFMNTNEIFIGILHHFTTRQYEIHFFDSITGNEINATGFIKFRLETL